MISVIVCTYNREKYIYNVLKSIADNDFPHTNYEILVIDNNCTDNTRAECDRFKADFANINFRYITEPRQGLSFARNCAIEQSKGDILIYVDDDATVNREYLKSYADFFEATPQASAAGGQIQPVYETAEPAWMSHYTKILITAYKYEGNNIKEFTKGKFPSGGNAAYRKQIFKKIGVFNTELGRKGNSLIGAEEKDLFDRMSHAGMKFYYIPQAILYHIITEQKLTEKYFKNLTYSIGKSERMRAKGISTAKYIKRIANECVKWAASIILFIFYTIKLQPQKGLKILQFRYNVTKGLLNL